MRWEHASRTSTSSTGVVDGRAMAIRALLRCADNAINDLRVINGYARHTNNRLLQQKQKALAVTDAFAD